MGDKTTNPATNPATNPTTNPDSPPAGQPALPGIPAPTAKKKRHPFIGQHLYAMAMAKVTGGREVRGAQFDLVMRLRGAGVTDATPSKLQNIRKGKNNPDVNVLAALADIAGARVVIVSGEKGKEVEDDVSLYLDADDANTTPTTTPPAA